MYNKNIKLEQIEAFSYVGTILLYIIVVFILYIS